VAASDAAILAHLAAHPIDGLRLSGIVQSVHIAVFVEPFLGYVLDGSKTLDSRFLRQPRAPYRRVAPGDLILLKRSGGPVVGLCYAAQAWDYALDPERFESIRSTHAEALCAPDAAFWESRRAAQYVTLIRLLGVRALVEPMALPKRDRRGWVVLRTGPEQMHL